MKTSAIAFLAILVTGCEPPRLSNSPEDSTPNEREGIEEETPQDDRSVSSDAEAKPVDTVAADDPHDPPRPSSLEEPGEQVELEGEKASDETEEVATRKEVSYPITRNLFDAQGRTFRAHILGRSEDSLYVERFDNNDKFTLPIEKLRKEDQQYVRSLPVTGKPRLSKEDRLAEDPYLGAREKEVERLRQEIAELRREAGSGDAGKFRRKRIRKEINQRNKEIAELNKDMDEYRKRELQE